MWQGISGKATTNVYWVSGLNLIDRCLHSVKKTTQNNKSKNRCKIFYVLLCVFTSKCKNIVSCVLHQVDVVSSNILMVYTLLHVRITFVYLFVKIFTCNTYEIYRDIISCQNIKKTETAMLLKTASMFLNSKKWNVMSFQKVLPIFHHRAENW